MIKKGDRVLYALTADDAKQVNRRRTTGPSIAERIERGVWPLGAQAHIGNTVREGQTFPGVVVEDWASESGAAGVDAKPNLQVWLDGTDTLWVTSAQEGDEPGMFTRLH